MLKEDTSFVVYCTLYSIVWRTEATSVGTNDMTPTPNPTLLWGMHDRASHATADLYIDKVQILIKDYWLLK
jgi:hypothetical protein